MAAWLRGCGHGWAHGLNVGMAGHSWACGPVPGHAHACVWRGCAHVDAARSHVAVWEAVRFAIGVAAWVLRGCARGMADGGMRSAWLRVAARLTACLRAWVRSRL